MNINALITLYSRDELFIVSTSLHLVYIYMLMTYKIVAVLKRLLSDKLGSVYIYSFFKNYLNVTQCQKKEE